MGYKLLVTQKAEQDVDSILSYIMNELGNPAAAVKLMTDIEERYDRLEEQPKMYAECTQPLPRARHYRKCVIGGYVMIYRVDEDEKTVYIERFFSDLEDYAEKL